MSTFEYAAIMVIAMFSHELPMGARRALSLIVVVVLEYYKVLQ